MADIRGRRAVLLPIILLMAGATAAVGFLPGYATIGILAPIALIVLLLALPLALVARFVRRRVSETSGFLALQESGQVIKSPSRRFGLMIASP
ncbi:MAG TPA: hypothetical protein VI036_04695 [Propionibacteriaceae bacterium]